MSDNLTKGPTLRLRRKSYPSKDTVVSWARMFDAASGNGACRSVDESMYSLAFHACSMLDSVLWLLEEAEKFGISDTTLDFKYERK